MRVSSFSFAAQLAITLAFWEAPSATAQAHTIVPTAPVRTDTVRSAQARPVSLQIIDTRNNKSVRDLQITFEEPVHLLNITLLEGNELLRDDGREVYEEIQKPLAFAYERDENGCSQLFFAESEGAFERPVADLTLSVRFRHAEVADTEEADEVIFRLRSGR